MPMIDKPLSELRGYRGMSPCPANIDDFWDASLAEMNAVEPNLELREADFQTPIAECFDLFFTGVGGARVYAKYLRPRVWGGDKHPAVLCFHGYTGNSGDWTNYLRWICAGFSVFAMDCRGQGGRSEDIGGVRGNTHHGQIIRGLEDGPEKLLMRSIFLDSAQLAKIAADMPEVDRGRMAATGGSQGGALTLVCAALVPGLRKAAPVYPFLSDYYRVWDMDLAKGAYGEITEWFRRFDPRHEREDEFFQTLSYIDIQNIAHRIRGEVKMFTGLMDTTCPPSTQFAAYNKITAPKSIVIMPDYGHENIPDVNDIIYNYLMNL